jgi:hypothetical protein
MIRIVLLWLGVTAVQLAELRASEPESLVLETTEAKSIKATMDFTAHYPNLQAREWTIFAAIPPELPSQKKVKSTLTPSGKTLKDKANPNRGYYEVRLTKLKKENLSEITVKLKIDATLYERHLRPAEADEVLPKVAELSAVEKKAALAELGPMDFGKSDFKKWLKETSLLREAKESEIAFAQRVFLYLRGKGKYDYRAEMKRDSSEVCKSMETDCGGWSMLFVSILRANQIPARTLYGRWAKSADEKEKLNGVPYYQWHVKAEFFASGVGWVPVDLSCGIVHDKSEKGLIFFGHDPGDFVTFHVDAHFDVDTKIFGVKTIFNMQTPQWYVTGEGDVKNPKFTEAWVVEK